MRSSGRRDRHRDADRRALLEVAERVFSRSGFAGASMRDIAAEAALSVGGVYQFFRGKDDLYLAVVDQLWIDYQDAVRPALAAPGFTARLEAFTHASVRFFAGRAAFLALYVHERASFPAAFHDRVARVVEQHKRVRRRQVVDMMKLGVSERRVRFDDPQLLASAYLGFLSQCNVDALSARGRALPAPGDLLSLFCDGVLRRH